MLRLAIIVLLLFPLASAEGGKVSGVELGSENLLLVWTEDPDAETTSVIVEESERLYARTVSFLQQEAAGRPVIVFRGLARTGPGPARDFPQVDSQGVVSLFRFGDDVKSYFHAFVHELVHALRIERSSSADWFFEEGFAEFVRLRVDDSMDGFPWFGFPVAMVAAGHLAGGTAIPLDRLRREHSALNQPCRAQAYALRAAFFDWLGSKHGDDAVLRMSGEASAGDLDQYRDFFGKPFAELEADWVEDMLEQHDAEQFDAYLKTTPIRFVPICPSQGPPGN